MEILGGCTVYSAPSGVIIIRPDGGVAAYVDGEWINDIEKVGCDGKRHYYLASDGRVVVCSFDNCGPDQLRLYDSWADMVEDLEEDEAAGDPESMSTPNIVWWPEDPRHACLGYNNYPRQWYIRGGNTTILTITKNN